MKDRHAELFSLITTFIQQNLTDLKHFKGQAFSPRRFESNHISILNLVGWKNDIQGQT